LDAAGHAYRFGSHYHPNERRLELAREDLTALPAAFESFDGFYARHPNYILTNPTHNLLALAIIAVAVLILIVWRVCRLLRRRRARLTVEILGNARGSHQRPIRARIDVALSPIEGCTS
jgi:hydroxyacylglutathione hydrolase